MREQWTDERLDDLATEVRDLRTEMRSEFRAVREEMAREFRTVRGEIRADLTDVRTDLRTLHADLSSFKTTMLGSTIASGTAIVVALVALLH